MEEEKFEGHRNGEMRKNNKISLEWSYETTSWNCWAKKWMFQWFSEEMRADDTGVDTSRHVAIKTADKLLKEESAQWIENWAVDSILEDTNI